MNYRRVFCFGDSWGYGSELKLLQGERPFAKLVAEKIGCDVENRSRPGRSLGLIVRDIAKLAAKIQDDDLVLIVVPPDSRWYTEWQTLDYENNAFFIDKTDAWFEYHHQLFVFAICEMLEKVGCEYMLMHNYGRFPLEKQEYWFSGFHHDRFLSTKSLTEILSDSDVDSTMSPIVIETSQHQLFRGIYFQGCDFHPNQMGHEKISQLVLEKLSSKH